MSAFIVIIIVMIGIILVNRNKGIEDEKLSVKKEYQTSDNQFVLKIISRDNEKIYKIAKEIYDSTEDKPYKDYQQYYNQMVKCYVYLNNEFLKNNNLLDNVINRFTYWGVTLLYATSGIYFQHDNIVYTTSWKRLGGITSPLMEDDDGIYVHNICNDCAFNLTDSTNDLIKFNAEGNLLTN